MPAGFRPFPGFRFQIGKNHPISWWNLTCFPPIYTKIANRTVLYVDSRITSPRTTPNNRST
jgi:hypothetical protein